MSVSPPSDARGRVADLALASVAPALDSLRGEHGLEARQGCRALIVVAAVAIAGVIVLVRVLPWDTWLDATHLGAIVAYAAAVILTWRIAMRTLAPAATTVEQTRARLEHEVLRPLIATLRPGARFDGAAAMPATMFADAELFHWAEAVESANRVQWALEGAELTLFDVQAIVQPGDDFPDRAFVGLLASTAVPGGTPQPVRIRSTRVFPRGAAVRSDYTPIPGRLGTHYLAAAAAVASIERLLTPALEDRLADAAARGLCLHAAVASDRAWVALEVEGQSWFGGYPTWMSRLLDALDADHVRDLEAQLDTIEGVMRSLLDAQAADRA